MQVFDSIPLIDETLAGWSGEIGRDLAGYRNHVYRMVNFTYAMGEFDDDARKKIAFAGCFHDIGIWPTRTLDYLDPSAERAEIFLAENGLEDWRMQVREMICQHHKLRSHRTDPLVEAFRKGDLVDFSLGLFKFGLPRSFV
ncbi:MAG: HD domain-containing protein, partial [Pyrinomonadaceae bacterium]